MAGMFDNPFVFNRAGILGQEYSPQSLYPGMFGEGGAFAPGGMFAPPTQTVSRETFPEWNILPVPGAVPETGPQTPPGLIPWEPLPTQPPVLPPPVEEEEPVVEEEVPSAVKQYFTRMMNVTKDSPRAGPPSAEAKAWLDANRGALPPEIAAMRQVARRERQKALDMFNMK